MKRAIAFVCVTFILLSVRLNAQQQQILIAENLHQKTLYQALRQIQKKYDVQFAYDVNKLKSIQVDCNIQNAPLSQMLHCMLDKHDLEFEYVRKNKILIIPASTKNKKTQSFTLQGVIKDVETAEALPYATIFCSASKQGCQSNENGRFQLKGLALGKQLIEISYVGYATQKFTVHKNTTLTISLTPSTQELLEVLIQSGSDQHLKVASAVGKLEINPKRVSTLSGLGEPDIFRAIQLIPGVSSNSAASDGLYIRGGSPDQNLVRFDGISSFRTDHFFGLLSAFNSRTIKSVEVSRGGFDARYGGRVSGRVDIEGRVADMHKPSLSFGMNLLSTNLLIETPIVPGKLSLLLAARRSYSDILQSTFYQSLFDHVTTPEDVLQESNAVLWKESTSSTNFFNAYNNFRLGTEAGGSPSELQTYYELNPKLNFRTANLDVFRHEADSKFLFHDINAKLSYRLGKYDWLGLTFITGTDKVAYRYSRPYKSFDVNILDKLQLQHAGLGLNWTKQWNNKLNSKTHLSYSNYSSQYEYSFETADDTSHNAISIDQQNKIQQVDFRTDINWKLSSKHQIQSGADISYQQLGVDLSFRPGLFWYEEDFGRLSAVYAQHIYKPDSKLKLTTGLRANYFDRTSSLSFSPRASIQYAANDKVNLKASWGVYHQFISRIKLNNGLGLGENFWALADNKRIPITQSQHFIVGGALNFKHFLIDLELYHKTTNGLITYGYGFRDNQLHDIEPGGNGELFSGGASYVNGLDLLLQKKQGKYTGWLSYSLGFVQQRFSDINRAKAFPALQDQRHELKWVNSLELGEWTFASTWFLISGKPYTDAATTYDAPDKKSYFLVTGTRNANRLPIYHRLDFTLSYKIKTPFVDGNVGFSIYNIYGRDNIQQRRFFIVSPADKKEEPVINSAEVFDLGFTPNIFFNLKF